MLRTFPEIENWMRLETQNYNDHWKNFQIRALSKVDYFASLHFSIREVIHYRLTLENYERGAKIFNRGHDCQNIFFIVSGEMELYIDQNNKEFELDTLTPGSIIGQYSIINESPYQYSGKAKTNLSILVLSRESIFQAAEEFIELTEQIEDATQSIIDFGTPWIDYRLAPTFGISKQSSFSKIDERAEDDFRDVVGIFKNAVRRVTVLNRNKELKVFKLIELINWIKAEKQRQQLSQSEAPMTSAPSKVAGRKSSVQNVGSYHGTKRVSLIHGAPPKKKSSKQLKLSFDYNPGQIKEGSLGENRGINYEGGYLGGDHFSTQNSSKQFNYEFSKLNRRLDHITDLLQNLTGDMSSVKVKLAVQKKSEPAAGHSMSTFGQTANQISKEKEQSLAVRSNSYQAQMSGIIEDEKENSSLNSSVSDTTPTTQKNGKQHQKHEKTEKERDQPSCNMRESKPPQGLGIFGGKQGLGDVVKVLQNQGTLSKRVSALDIQTRQSIINQPNRMSRLSEYGQSSMKTSPFISRTPSIEVSPKGHHSQVSNSQAPQPSPTKVEAPTTNQVANIPILQIGKLSHDGDGEKKLFADIEPEQRKQPERTVGVDLISISPLLVESLLPTKLESPPKQSDVLKSNASNKETQSQKLPQSLNPQDQQKSAQPSKHINQNYIQQVMGLIQKKQAAARNISQGNSLIGHSGQQQSNTLAQSLMKAASPSSSAGLISNMREDQDQKNVQPPSLPKNRQTFEYTQLSDESSGFAQLQSATMQYLQKSGISGSFVEQVPQNNQHEDEKEPLSGQLSSQNQHMLIGQASQSKPNFFRISNSRNQVQPVPQQYTIQELSSSVLEPANHRMTMSPRQNHQDLTKYQPTSFVTPNQVNITLNTSQASSLLTTNLLAQQIISPPILLQPLHVQSEIESNSAKSTNNQPVRKSRDKQRKPPEVTQQSSTVMPQPSKVEKEEKKREVALNIDEDEEYYDESMVEASGQGVDDMIEQEIERMLEDGRTLENEFYDQGADDATRSDI